MADYERIIPHVLNADAFASELKNFLISTEANKNEVYADIMGVPTIGVGYALVQKVNGLWQVRANLDTQMATIGKTITAQDRSILQSIADGLNEGDVGAAKGLAKSSFSFEPMTDDQAKNLLAIVVTDEYAPLLENKIGNSLYNYLGNSRELIALLSITYQNPSAIKQPFIDALNAGNRAEVWYTIRYALNQGSADWKATRRYKEASKFWLYNDSITVDSAKEVMRMYTSHKARIASYEQRFNPASAGAPAIGDQAGIGASQNYLIASFSLGKPIDGEVMVGAGLASYAYKEGSSERLTGTAANDLIFGEKGDDVITGGRGDDVIYGGEGNDTYIINTGDGLDTIEDKQGDRNTVVINGREINLLIPQTDGSFRSPDGKITAEIIGTALVVTDVTGTKAILNEDFQWGDFGINLIDVPDAPVITNTILGDQNPGNLNDILADTAASDRIEGLTGNDDIHASQGGNDWLVGGGGEDRIISENATGDDILEGNAGSDILWGGSGSDRVFGETSGEMETLISDGETAENVSTRGDLATGGTGNDFVYGSNARDLLFGGDGYDLLVGGAGDDVILGDDEFTYATLDWSFSVVGDPNNAWSHTLWISGIDRISESAYGDDAIYAGTGNDLVIAGGGNDEVYAGAGDDAVFGGAGDDFTEGGDGNDILSGDEYSVPVSAQGNDYIDGGSGTDLMRGDAGDDDLFGGDGNDTIYGQGCNDTIFKGDEIPTYEWSLAA